MIVTAQSIGQDTGFITFNSQTKVISWRSNSNFDVGNYFIEITGELNGFYKTMSFNLVVKVQQNNFPILSGISSKNLTFGLSDLRNDGTYNFGPLLDPDIDDTVWLTYIV